VGTLLDAYALIALLAQEQAEPEVKRLLRRGDVAMPSVNLAEAIDYLERREKIAEEELRPLIEQLPFEVLPLDEPTAWSAARLRARHYHRRRRPVSLADCVLVASSKAGDEVATNDPAVLDMARDEGVKVRVLT
jgi:predicted nucleic acid-binding protein